MSGPGVIGGTGVTGTWRDWSKEGWSRGEEIEKKKLIKCFSSDLESQVGEGAVVMIMQAGEEGRYDGDAGQDQRMEELGRVEDKTRYIRL